MNPKTKKKIEATADKYWTMEEHDSTQIAFEDGAELFAEWCERFEKAINQVAQINGLNPRVVPHVDIMFEVLNEYREWLEEQ